MAQVWTRWMAVALGAVIWVMIAVAATAQDAVFKVETLNAGLAERPGDLVVYGGIGKAARNWACFDAIVDTLKRLDDDQTLLVQSGKPVGVFQNSCEKGSTPVLPEVF